MTDIIVLIPTHGRPTLLERTLRSLADCKLPPNFREAVVVENGSRSGAESVVLGVAEAYPHLPLRYMHFDQANKSNALNRALADVDRELAIFLDDDVRLDPNAIMAYADAANRASRNVFLGGSVGIDYQKKPMDWLLPNLCMSAVGYDLNFAQPHLFLGYNWAAYSDHIRAVGGFDVRLGPGTSMPQGDEPELQFRLKASGKVPICVPDAWVYHYVPEDRCSKQWISKRKFDNGTCQGYRALKRGEARARLLSKSLLGVGRSFPKVLAWTFLRNEKRRWNSIFKLKFHLGLLKALLHKSDEGGMFRPSKR